MLNDVQRRGFSEAEAATYLGVSQSTLRHGRSEGQRDGRMPQPPFVRLGRRIIYLRDDLDAWLFSHRSQLINPVER